MYEYHVKNEGQVSSSGNLVACMAFLCASYLLHKRHVGRLYPWRPVMYKGDQETGRIGGGR